MTDATTPSSSPQSGPRSAGPGGRWRGSACTTSPCRPWRACIAAAATSTPADIDDIVLGEALQGGGCTARYVANALGLPPDTPGGATQRQCATGMMAVQDAAANIRAGMADVVVAGGVETMTRYPVLFEKSPSPFGGMERFSPPSHPDSPEAPEHERAHHGG